MKSGLISLIVGFGLMPIFANASTVYNCTSIIEPGNPTHETMTLEFKKRHAFGGLVDLQITSRYTINFRVEDFTEVVNDGVYNNLRIDIRDFKFIQDNMLGGSIVQYMVQKTLFEGEHNGLVVRIDNGTQRKFNCTQEQ